MVVVQVRDDDVLDRVCLDADGFQALLDRLDDRAAALARHRLVEPGVDDEGSVRTDDGPDKIRERLKNVVRVSEQKVLRRLPVVVRVAHGVDLVNVVSHISP